ncbi:inositol monophosphatase family protein [Solwaraspora sp. WMMB335]|uniref:inositol monophosphatase family protein n=1 Tax=Solwaraspora sp. WMMB335 TaxID=3404118 RepID=UPI003B95C11B
MAADPEPSEPVHAVLRDSLDDLLTIAVAATGRGAELMRTRDPGHLAGKGDRDLRAFLAEETVLDPIDGTVNFAHTVPLCGVSLGLVSDQRPVLGVVELPFLSSRYSATVGGGAWCDGRPIRIRGAAQLSDALVNLGDYAVGADAERSNAARFALAEGIARTTLRVRMLGSAAVDLVWVAEGRADVAIALSNKPWDTAAGTLIAREAGAAVVDVDGSPQILDKVLAIVDTALRTAALRTAA